jgi:hypothetical protein
MTGAVLRRFGLAGSPRFLWECQNGNNPLNSVSQPKGSFQWVTTPPYADLRPGSVTRLRNECRNYWQSVNTNVLAVELVPAVTESGGACMWDCVQSDTPAEPGTNAFASTV